MIRTILFDIALFFLPFALYGLYLLVAEKAREDAASGHPHPWVALFCAGLILAISGLIYLGLKSDTPPTSQDDYHPHWTLPKLDRHG